MEISSKIHNRKQIMTNYVIEILKSEFPMNAMVDFDKYSDFIPDKLFQNNIDTDNRMAGFLSQVGHESGGFLRLEENLMYSAKRLLQVFPKYFNETTAKNAEYKPQVIANKIYANRMGNGNESTNDGFRFRGRGLIQLTGYYNYLKCGNDIGKNLIENPDYLLTIEGAIDSAIWYWNNRNCNKYADVLDIIGLTKAINGGTIGLEHRTKLFNSILQKLKMR